LTLSFRHFGIKLCLLLLKLLNYLLGNGKFRFRTFNLLGERLGELTHLLLQGFYLRLMGRIAKEDVVISLFANTSSLLGTPTAAGWLLPFPSAVSLLHG